MRDIRFFVTINSLMSTLAILASDSGSIRSDTGLSGSKTKENCKDSAKTLAVSS